MEDLGELLFGEWEGMSFAELDGREDWRRFNTCRGGVRPPGGELMIESPDAHGRPVRMPRRAASSTNRSALVSHGDPLRSLIAYFWEFHWI